MIVRMSTPVGGTESARIDRINRDLVVLTGVDLARGEHTGQRLWKVAWTEIGGGREAEGYVDLLDPRAEPGHVVVRGYTVAPRPRDRKLAISAATAAEVLEWRKKRSAAELSA